MFDMHWYYLWIILILHFTTVPSHATVVQPQPIVETTVDHNKPPKKKKHKKYHRGNKVWQSWFKKDQINHGQHMSIYGLVKGLLIALVVLLLLGPVFLIIGSFTGGLGWFIAGAVLSGLWILLGSISAIGSYDSGITGGSFITGILILAALFLIFLGLFIAAISIGIPTLLTFSLVLGGSALLGMVIAFGLLGIAYLSN